MSDAPAVVLLSIEIQRRSSDLVIRLSGALDVVSSALLELPRSVADVDVGKLIVDVSALETWDVAGIRSLARLHDELTAAGLLVHLVGAKPKLRQLAQVSGIPVGFLGAAESVGLCEGGPAPK